MTPTSISVDAFLRLAADHLWQSTLVVVMAAALCVLLRRHAARVRYAVYLLATTKFLVPFTVLAAVGSTAPWPVAVGSDAPVAVTTVFTLGQPFVSPVHDSAAAARSAPHTTAPAGTFMTYALALTWLVGGLVVAARRLAAAARVVTIRRHATPLLCGREFDAFIRAGGRQLLDSQVALCTVAGTGSPCVVGVARPVLLWPDGLSAALSDRQLDAIMGHELAHVRRRHNLDSVIQAAAEIIFWFHPAIWWLGARLVAERERACDEDVVQSGALPSDYAGAILMVCEHSLGRPTIGATGITSSTLTRRVEAIMSVHTPQSPGRVTKTVLALLGLSMFIGPMAAGSMSAQGGTTGRIAGVVTDERGGVLPDVSVTARATTTGVTRSAVTDQSGRYRLSDLVPGEHEVRFARDAFRPHVVRVDLGAGAAATADAQLRVGGVTESIRLTAAPSEGQPRSADSEATLLHRIADKPEESAPHLALAELYYREERFAESASVMARAAALFAAEQLVRPNTTAAAASGDIEPPRKLRDVKPIYPADARASGVTGMVILEATIAEDGTVQDAVVRRSVPMLDEAALGAVRQWLFTPTRLNGVPVAVTMSANITFGQD
jgi:TonB family protein